MKTPIRALLASAAFLFATLAGHCFAQSDSVTIDISGTVQSGHNFIVTSGTQTIAPAHIYYYAVSGSCYFIGELATILSGTYSIGDALTAIEPPGSDFTQYLSGDVVDVPGTFPFKCLDKLSHGVFHIVKDGFHITAAGHVLCQAGIQASGVCYGSFTKLSLTIGPASIPTGFVLLPGSQVLVQTTPISGPAAANLSFLDPIGHVDGIGVTGTGAAGHSESVTLKKGHSQKYMFALENSGTAASTFTLSAPPLAADTGFAQKFMYKTANITPKVTGTAGYTFPKTGTLDGGGAATFSWIITNKKAAASTTVSSVLTAAPTTSGSSDSLVITGSAP